MTQFDQIDRNTREYVLERTFESVKVVKRAADLVDIDSNINYLIDGVIDMGDQPIEVPNTGISIGGLNASRGVSGLISSEPNYSLFIPDSGAFTGNIIMEDLRLKITGSGSKVFDLKNDVVVRDVNDVENSIDVRSIDFVDCTSLGVIDAYRNLLFLGITFVRIEDGLTFSGQWTGSIFIKSCLTIDLPSLTLFKEGPNLTIAGQVISDIEFLDVDTACVLFDLQPSNLTRDSALQLRDMQTTALDPLPNLPNSNVKVRYRNCVGIDCTIIGGQWTISSESVTDIINSNTLVKLAGTTAYTDLQWFSGSVDNAFLFDSSVETEIQIEGALSFSGTNNNVMGLQVRQWDHSVSAYIDIGARFKATLNAAGRVENMAFFARTKVNLNDRIEIWIENQSGSSDITGALGGFVGISQRSS